MPIEGPRVARHRVSPSPRPHSDDTHLKVYVNERFQGAVTGMVRTLQVEWEGQFGWPRGEHVVRIAICDDEDRVKAQQSVLFQKK